MKNAASILGFILPSTLCLYLVVAFKSELHATTSGEVAAGIIAGAPVAVLGTLALACIPNVLCTVIAAHRKESLWKMSALGIPVCVALTILTTIVIS